MNYTLLRAGCTTHLKIVGVALAAAIAVVIVGISARTTDMVRSPGNDAAFKAGQPVTYAGQENSTIR